jgi:hypothetical protein
MMVDKVCVSLTILDVHHQNSATKERLNEAVSVSRNMSIYLDFNQVQKIEYVFSVKGASLKKFYNQSSPFVGALPTPSFREKISLFSFFRREGDEVYYIIMDENYVGGSNSPMGRLTIDTTFLIEDEANQITTKYVIKKIEKLQ